MSENTRTLLKIGVLLVLVAALYWYAWRRVREADAEAQRRRAVRSAAGRKAAVTRKKNQLAKQEAEKPVLVAASVRDEGEGPE